MQFACKSGEIIACDFTDSVKSLLHDGGRAAATSPDGAAPWAGALARVLTRGDRERRGVSRTASRPRRSAESAKLLSHLWHALADPGCDDRQEEGRKSILTQILNNEARERRASIYIKPPFTASFGINTRIMHLQ